VDEVQDLAAFLPPLLRAMEGLGFVARYMHPPQLGQVIEAAGAPDEALAAARGRLDAWPERLSGVRSRLWSAADEVMAGFEELRSAVGADSAGPAFRAMRRLPRAQEAIWPLATGLAPVSRYFLSPDRRDDAELLARLEAGEEREDVGVSHFDNEPGMRGGWSLFVPETVAADRPAPLVVAMHGGSGNGRAFLWTWLRDARSRGAILVSPTAVGNTWALNGRDLDTPNLQRMVGEVRARWSIDPARLLLTGMSDGGTFSYISGLEPDSIFTHLAPVSAAFHPMLAQMADPDRLKGLPIHITHGALDWMFPIPMAREASAALTAAGADVTYLEIEDLSHTYPREANPRILDWFLAGD
jgi:phospholipase/carboxylesterase